jgi:hypothetical protein
MITGQSYRQHLNEFIMAGKDRRRQHAKKFIEATIETQVGFKKSIRICASPIPESSPEKH